LGTHPIHTYYVDSLIYFSGHELTHEVSSSLKAISVHDEQTVELS